MHELEPTLSIITICFNDIDGLSQTLQSLPEERAVDWEHIIIDGGSTDGSAEMALHYASTRPWVRVVSEADEGIYDAMNKGLALSRGRFVWYLNAGDRSTGKRSLSTILDHLQSTTGVWAMGHVYHEEIGRRSTSLPFDNWAFWTGRQGYNHQGLFMSSRFLRAVGGHNAANGFAADLHVLAKAVAVSRPTEIPMDVASYKGGGFSSAKVAGTPFEFHRIRADLLGITGFTSAASLIFAYLQVARRHGFGIARREYAIRKKTAS
ncbi:glycosyltransferase involved in cell wall biosynthesis [Microbacterium sp. SORGH_AS 1204]|uniref:glycosyltransferase n=1 Tax=Microbacterium sp. SORGH_AS_1204 TaxID=3041785 RepID=UPI002793582B|nr:glycosyltransferase [Microbacterium sp. SORGH_AS_1204]MDQ1137028.1 glycosyltransferase involved in cell wall biosynthesis [Microbacterium sp. SORGH_AS_1204]